MRKLELTRDEAEYLVDLLEVRDIPFALDLAAEIRELFGMVTRERELEAIRERHK